MKYKQLAYTLLLALTSALTQAQVKIGNNPTTITPGALLDIEGGTTTTRTVSLTNGNFGIGLTNPATQLEVKGVIRSSTGVSTDGSIDLIPGDATNAGYISFNKPGDRLAIFGYGGTTANDLLLQAKNASSRVAIVSWAGVGIGTYTPTNALHVNGTNPLRLDGLQAGSNGDNVLVSDANGVVRTVARSTFNFVSPQIPYLSIYGTATKGSQEPSNVTYFTNLNVDIINRVTYDGNSGEVIFQEGGLYYYTFNVTGATNAPGTATTNEQCATLFINGVNYRTSCGRSPNSAASTSVVSGIYYLSAGTRMKIAFATASTAAFTGEYSASFYVYRIGS